MAFIAHTLKMVLLVAVLVPFGFSAWPVVQASSFYGTTVPIEQSCVARGANRYRC